MPWAPDYLSLDEFKNALQVEDARDDFEAALAVGSASRAVDRCTKRQFGRVEVVEARVYEAVWSNRQGRWKLRIDDLQTTDDLVVTVNGEPLEEDQFSLRPLNAPQEGFAYTHLLTDSVTKDTAGRGRPTVQVEERWGWTSFPTPVVEATLIQGLRFFKRKDAPFGVAGSPDSGSEVRLLARVDPDVELALKPYRRDWLLV